MHFATLAGDTHSTLSAKVLWSTDLIRYYYELEVRVYLSRCRSTWLNWRGRLSANEHDANQTPCDSQCLLAGAWLLTVCSVI